MNPAVLVTLVSGLTHSGLVTLRSKYLMGVLYFTLEDFKSGVGPVTRPESEGEEGRTVCL